jgi:hypothetical protein
VEEREQDGHSDQSSHGAHESYEFRKQNERGSAVRIVMGDTLVQLHTSEKARLEPIRPCVIEKRCGILLWLAFVLSGLFEGGISHRQKHKGQPANPSTRGPSH